MLMDPYGRKISYLRLSVTEQCNLNCFYCRLDSSSCSVEDVDGRSLSREEFVKIGKAAASLGMDRIRLTGGEPLLYPHIVNLVSDLSVIPGIKDLSMTTNACFLHEMALPLAKAGLKRVNISLDSLQAVTYRKITNGGALKNVLKGIENALKYGLTPLKINMVLLRGINDREIKDFARMTLDRPLDIRFIEYMPIADENRNAWEDRFLSLENVVEACSTLGKLEPVQGDHGGGPAQYYRIDSGIGKIGLISPLSRHFCRDCNRLRVTSDGKIKPCLFSGHEVDLRPHLGPASRIEDIAGRLQKTLELRPDPDKVAGDPSERVCQLEGRRTMFRIGG